MSGTLLHVVAPCGAIAAIAVAAAPLVTGCTVSSEPAHVVVERLGIRFSYPTEFRLGRFAPDPPPAPSPSPFADAAVLVDPVWLGDRHPDSIPVGDIPTIWLERKPLSARRAAMLQPSRTYDVPAGNVRVFPGYPGPYGDQAYYYALQLGDDEFLEIFAHRYLFTAEEAEPPESHYDHVIEAILETVRPIP